MVEETPGRPGPRPAYRLYVLLGLLVVATGGALVARVRLTRAGSHGEHGQCGASMATVMLEQRLAKTPPSEHLAVLLETANAASASSRYVAVDALGSRREPQAADALERAFRDSASVVRQRAVEVLPKVDRDRGLRLILAALRDHDNWIRETAVSQLNMSAGKRKTFVDRRAVPMLVKALADEDPAVPPMAMSALSKLTGNPWRVRNLAPAEQKTAVAARWQRWWMRARASWRVAPAYAEVPAVHPARAEAAPRIRLVDLDRRDIRLADPRGKVRLLNFWSPTAGPSVEVIPLLVRIDGQYRARGVEVVGVASDAENATDIRRWCKDHGVAYRQALAPSTVQEAFGAGDDVPVTVLIDGHGRVRYMWEGDRDFGTFQTALERVLSGNADEGVIQAPVAAAAPEHQGHLHR